MSNSEILKSFEPKKELNPKIWEKKGDSYSMNPKVREKLLEVSNIFIDSLGVDVLVTDIIMIGSLTNYNWSKFSDILNCSRHFCTSNLIPDFVFESVFIFKIYTPKRIT